MGENRAGAKTGNEEKDDSQVQTDDNTQGIENIDSPIHRALIVPRPESDYNVENRIDDTHENGK